MFFKTAEGNTVKMARYWVLGIVVLASCLFLESSAQTPDPNDPDNCTASANCEECVVRPTACFWCDNPQKCLAVQNGAFLTDITECPGYQWKWGQCVLNGIVVAVLLALLIIFFLIAVCAITCCIACFCRRRRRERLARADYKYSREREAIKAEHSRKKEEKESRREEIRKKYGLFDESATHDSGYHPVD